MKTITTYAYNSIELSTITNRKVKLENDLEKVNKELNDFHLRFKPFACKD